MRAVSFLAATQREDGSWPMTSRDHPGIESTRKPIRNPVPITYFGSAWATLGLVRSVPAAPDSAEKQQHAFDEIKRFHGKFEVDEKSPDRPVLRVDLRYYDVSDEEVANFAKVLQAFPQLDHAPDQVREAHRRRPGTSEEPAGAPQPLARKCSRRRRRADASEGLGAAPGAAPQGYQGD